MSDLVEGILGFFIVGCFFIGLVTILVLFMIGIPLPQQAIVDRGAAYYHPVTGEFTWKSGNVILKGDGRDE